MTQTTPARKPCGTCGNEYTVTANGTIRHHLTENPDFQVGPDSRKCKGAGQPPAGVVLGEDQPQCRLCKHPVQLSGNGRARSHLTPEATPRPCPAGSDFPLGTYPDIVGTTDGLVATLARDCGHVPAGECYGCYGAAGNPISDADLKAMEEAQGTGTAPWGVQPDTVAQPTMADQLKASAPSGDERDRWQALNEEWTRQRDDDTRAEAERFMAAVTTDHRTPEARDARTSELTAKAIEVLERRTPEQKAETAARMDRTASAALGLPLDPVLNHRYTDPSGTVWVHGGPAEVCQVPDCVLMRCTCDSEDHTHDGGCPAAPAHPEGFDPNCEQCDTDTHRCPGCGTDVPHGTVACTPCDRRVMANRLPKGETEDGRPCFHDDAVFGVENDQLVCIACGTPCTHPDGFQGSAEGLRSDGQDNVVSVCELCGAMDPEDEEPEGQDCRGCGHWTFEADGRCTDCKAANEAVSQALADRRLDTGPVLLGELEVGEHFIRRGTVMRVTQTLSGDVHAVIVEGPMKGRTGVLPNNHEAVERTHCRHEYTWADDGKFGHAGSFCDYCGAGDPATEPRTKEQETKECPDETMLPRSSAASTTTTAPAPGSPPTTAVSAPAVSPKSESVTPSGPTAKAAGNSRGAAVTTDQSAAAAAFLGGGQPSVPAQPGPANPTDAAAQFLAGGSGAHGEKETKRDRFGRYLIPHPDTGKEQAWTRATTFAKSISDTYALSQWGLRMALLGATVRPDIVQRAHGKHVKADKQLLDELTADLKNAAGDKVAANLGTSMHSFTEMADRAWHSPGGARSVLNQVPLDCQGMVSTYIRLLEETGLEPVPNLIEFTTVVKQYGVAGTSDNCYKVTKPLTLKIGRAEVRLEPGQYVIGDKKTGKDLDYGWQEIVIQLATYAQGINTAGVWHRVHEEWIPDPLNGAKVRLDAGVVIHLPVDKESEKQPAVYGVDLESGWNAAVLCERVRAWRKVRYLASPVMVSGSETFVPARSTPGVTTRTTVRPPSLRDKANAVTSKGEASAVWQEAKKAGMPDAEVDELVALMQSRLKKLAEPGG